MIVFIYFRVLFLCPFSISTEIIVHPCSSSALCSSSHCEEYIKKISTSFTIQHCSVFNPMGPVLELSLQVEEENLQQYLGQRTNECNI